MAYELYKILELSSKASVREVKYTYSQLVRKYKKENDFEKFTLIRKAYEILTSSDLKDTYDSLQSISNLLEIAQSSFQQGNWTETVQLLKRIVIESPEENEIQKLVETLPQVQGVIEEVWSSMIAIQEKHGHIQNWIGLCYTYDQKWSDAISLYRKLTHQYPESPHYWISFGQVYKRQCLYLLDEEIKLYELYQSARECFEKAISLKPDDSEPYLEIAQTYLKERKYPEAINWAERAIDADGILDSRDLDALCFLCIIYATTTRLNEVEEQVQKIKKLSMDDVSKQSASMKFCQYGNELYKIASEQFAISNELDFSSLAYLFDTSLAFFKAANEFDSFNEAARKQCSDVGRITMVLSQLSNLKNDTFVLECHKNLVLLSLFDYLSSDVNNSAHIDEILVNSVFVEIVKLPNTSIHQSIERLKKNYNTAYNFSEELFNKLDNYLVNLDVRQVEASNSNMLRLEETGINQDFLERIRNAYATNSSSIRRKVDVTASNLYALFEPLSEEIFSKYSDLKSELPQLLDGKLDYQSFLTFIKERSSQDTAIIRRSTRRLARQLHSILNPITEKIVTKYPGTQVLISSLMDSLLDSSLDDKVD